MHRLSQRCVRLVYLPVILLLTTPMLGTAQLVYTNGVPDNLDGWAVFAPYTTANDFSLLTATTLGSFDWYLSRHAGGGATITSSFYWQIFDDAGGTVGSAQLWAGSGTYTGTLTPFFCCGTPTYEDYLFSVSFGGLTLGPGQYWLAISQYHDPTDPNYGYWATSAQVGNQMINSGGSWSSTDAEGAFSIYAAESAIPEPGSLALLATGLFGLVPGIRRKLRL